MTDAPELIDITLIVPNRYQPRTQTDPAAVAELATSIEKNGLLQPPTVRKVHALGQEMIDARNNVPVEERSQNGYITYELAFGHTRFEAFKLLVSQGKSDYLKMPVFVRELTELQMFEMAVAENIKRKDLNPLEQATAMKRYMTEFRKSSVEAGEFFGISDATVRGTVRLLDLPETARTELAAGRITVGTARKLLTVQKIDDGKNVNAVVKAITEGQDPEAVVGQLLSHDAYCMWESWRHDQNPRGGPGLWALTDTIGKKWADATPELDARWAAKAMEGRIQQVRDVCDGQFHAVINSFNYSGKFSQLDSLPDDQATLLVQLGNPPACTVCPFYVRNGGSHYCTWKPCWERKRKGFARWEMEKLSQKLNIPIWDKDTDPKDSIPVESIWSQDYDYNTKWEREGKSKHYEELWKDEATRGIYLRLRIKFSSGMYGNKHELTNHDLVEVVDTDPKMIAWLAKSKEKKKAEIKKAETGQSEGQLKDKNERVNRDLFDKFVDQVAAPIFSDVLQGLENLPILKYLVRIQYFSGVDENKIKSMGEVEQQRYCRSRIMNGALLNKFEYSEKVAGPAKCAPKIIELAQAWGVTLPADFQAQAEAFGTTPVATETAEEEPEDILNEELEEEA